MSSTPYLENYMDSLEYLPSDLQRNFKLMLELDGRAQILLKEIDDKSNHLMSSILSDDTNNSLSDRDHEIKIIKSAFNLVNEYGEDKVQLANQSYELVDKYIRKLDVNLLKFEKEIEEKYKNNLNTDDTESLGDENVSESVTNLLKSICMRSQSSLSVTSQTKSTTNNCSSLENSPSTSSKRGKKKSCVKRDGKFSSIGRNQQIVNAESDTGKSSLQTRANESENVMLHMAVDPNEPTYCLCAQVSYGEMIGCDNADCLIEWFHFPCVGLNIKPKGKWFCPNCRK